jgi:hypothetical protein
MSTSRELPERQPADGPIHVTRVTEGIAISVTTHGIEQGIVCSEYNAARVLAVLCIMLQVPIPKAIGKMAM